jgi:hypothetical protein
MTLMPAFCFSTRIHHQDTPEGINRALSFDKVSVNG